MEAHSKKHKEAIPYRSKSTAIEVKECWQKGTNQKENNKGS